MTLPFDHTHDIDLEVSTSEYEIASGMGWLVDMEWKGYESSIHDHDIDYCVTMVGWVGVPDNDRSDFRRRRAVDIHVSSFTHAFEAMLSVVLGCMYVLRCFVNT